MSVVSSLLEGSTEYARLLDRESLRAQLESVEDGTSLWLQTEHARFVLCLRLARLLSDFLDTDDGRRLFATVAADFPPTYSPKDQSDEMREFCP